MKALYFFKSLGYLLLLNLLIKPVWIFGVDRQVQNVVGHETYGQYFALLSLALVFSFFADAGLTQMVNRQVAAGEQFGAAQLLRLKGALVIGYFLLVALFAAVTGIDNWYLLGLVVVTQALTSFLVFLRQVVTAHQLFATDAVLSIIDKLLMVSVLLPLLYTSLFAVTITIPTFLYLQLACTAITCATALYIIFKRGLLQSSDNQKRLPIKFRQVLPFALIMLLMTAHNRLDGFLLERLHHDGAFQAGMYAAAYRLLDAGNMIGYLTASFLVPFLARNRTNKLLLEATVLSARWMLLLAGGVAAVWVIVFAKEVQSFLYPALPLQSVRVLQTCMAVLPAYLLLHVYGSVLTALNGLKHFIFLLIAAFVMNLLLNLWLIPVHGAWGSGVAALVSQYAVAVGCYIVASKKEGIRFHVSSLVVVVLIVAAAGALALAGRQNVLNSFWLVTIGTAGAALLLLVYIPFFKKTFLTSG